MLRTLRQLGGVGTYARLTRRRRAADHLSCSMYSSSGEHEESTIYALATGGTRCGLAVIRVSGSRTAHIMQTLARLPAPPEPRKAILRSFYDPNCPHGTILDTGMLLWFPRPKSYTGQDVCELIVHGGTAVVAAFLRCLSTFEGCRMAEPGEFSKRAFLNGKIRNLTEIDGLHDLIMAETEQQRVQAVNQMRGSLGSLYTAWKDEISQALAFAEAHIDFGEDENIEDNILDTVNAKISKVVAEIGSHLSDGRRGERLRNGVTVTITGKPNAGKSSLLNILCQRQAAIVSHIPGTTRDVIETTLNLGGYPVVLADTAGLRTSTPDTIESEGIRRAQEHAEQADIIISLIDWASYQNLQCTSRESLLQEQLHHLRPQMGEINQREEDELTSKMILVLNKIDLCENMEQEESNKLHEIFDAIISCRTKSNMEKFLTTLTERVASLCANPKAEPAYITQERYRVSLEKCGSHLEDYLNDTDSKDLALRTNHLKLAVQCIGVITGHVGTEDILDIIFRDFCIGK